MTREEAIALLNEQYETCKRIYRKSYPNVPQFMEALGMALSALRPVSRERVEKAWKSEWTDSGKRDLNGVPKPFAISCERCGSSAGVSWMKFCPNCGAPMTDEAVEMVMERMETINNA